MSPILTLHASCSPIGGGAYLADSLGYFFFKDFFSKLESLKKAPPPEKHTQTQKTYPKSSQNEQISEKHILKRSSILF